MAMSGVRKNFSYLFGILTVAMYFIGLIIINRGLGFRNAMIIVSALIAYYIANVYNVATNKYKLKDMTTVIVINGILMTVTTFSKIFTFYEGIVLFGIITIFQIAFRYIVIMGVVEKERVVFVGENDYTEDLLESVKKDGQYVFVTSLNNTDMKALGKEILELYNTKKFDVLVDFTDKLLRDPKITEKLLQYKLEGLQYYNYLEFYETYENKLPISHLSPKWFLENTGFEIYHNNFNLKAKRLLDLLFALLAWLSVPFNVLVLGSDARPWQQIKGSRSDAIIVIKVIPLLAKIKMISIPRDTYTDVPCEKGGKVDKINHSYAFGGRECTIKAVEELLDTKINYSVVFRFDDVITLTDIMGGVDIVANHSFTQDNETFKEGEKYNIKGARALAYTRHRKTDSAFKRDERQRQVMQSIAKKLVSPAGWGYVPGVYSYMQEKMDISFNPIKGISALPAILINKTNFEQHEIKGDGKMIKGIWYFIPEDASLNDARKEFKVWF